jgi:hypothetical protein
MICREIKKRTTRMSYKNLELALSSAGLEGR